MFKPSHLRPFAVCSRLIVMLVLWSLFLVGANDVRRAAEGQPTLYEGLKRLAVYSLMLRADP